MWVLCVSVWLCGSLFRVGYRCRDGCVCVRVWTWMCVCVCVWVSVWGHGCGYVSVGPCVCLWVSGLEVDAGVWLWVVWVWL